MLVVLLLGDLGILVPLVESLEAGVERNSIPCTHTHTCVVRALKFNDVYMYTRYRDSCGNICQTYSPRIHSLSSLSSLSQREKTTQQGNLVNIPWECHRLPFP